MRGLLVNERGGAAIGCFGQFLCLARGPFLRLGLGFRPRRAQRRSSEERSNPQPRAAPYSEHGEACEHRTLTGASTTRRSSLAGTSRPIRLGWFAASG